MKHEHEHNSISSDSAEAEARMLVQMTGPELGRKSFRHFVLQTMPSFQEARHHRMIMEALQMVEQGIISRLIISMPPRHGKSELVSVRFPAWYLGKHPNEDIIHVSYGADLSNDFSRRVRSLVRDDAAYRGLFPDLELDPERQRVNDWRLVNRGGFRSVGTGAGVTGHGAHVLVIDDPHKEGEITPTLLRQVFEWYTTGARTRLMPGGKIVLCMTRWDLQDLVGQVVKAANADSNADQWWVLNLPGLVVDDEMAASDPLGRSVGEALWPEWYPPEALLAVKALSDVHFQALYQQDPRAINVQMFSEDGFQKVARADQACERAAWCFDLALGEDDASDYTAWARATYERETKVIGFSRLFRERLTWPKAKEKILELMVLFPDDDFVFPKHILELMAVQEFRHEVPDMVSRIRGVSFPANSDKRSRAQVLADRCSKKRVVIEDCEIADLWIAEHTEFPAEHDDMVDVGSVATHHFGLQQEFSAAIADIEAKARQRAAEMERMRDVYTRLGVFGAHAS